MKGPYQTTIEYVIAALNRDILREVRMSDECIHRVASVAQPYAHFHNRILRCAASAMSNASALATEVLSLGGVPSESTPGPQKLLPVAASMEEYFVQAGLLVAHYQDRLAMAEKLGLLRLRETLREIIASKRLHMAHALVIAAIGVGRKQLN